MTAATRTSRTRTANKAEDACRKEGILYGRSARRTHEVFDDHQRLLLEGRLEGDLARNYAEDVVLLTVNWNETRSGTGSSPKYCANRRAYSVTDGLELRLRRSPAVA